MNRALTASGDSEILSGCEVTGDMGHPIIGVHRWPDGRAIILNNDRKNITFPYPEYDDND